MSQIREFYLWKGLGINNEDLFEKTLISEIVRSKIGQEKIETKSRIKRYRENDNPCPVISDWGSSGVHMASRLLFTFLRNWYSNGDPTVSVLPRMNRINDFSFGINQFKRWKVCIFILWFFLWFMSDSW